MIDLIVYLSSVCQRYGHFQAQCEYKEDPRCARCGGEHQTVTCTEEVVAVKCINCVRAGYVVNDHSSSFRKCPVYLNELEKAKLPNPSNLN